MTENDVHCLVCWIRVSCNPIHSFLPLIILQKYIHSTHLSGRLELSVCMCRLCICLSMCLCVGVLVSICVHDFLLVFIITNIDLPSYLSSTHPSIPVNALAAVACTDLGTAAKLLREEAVAGIGIEEGQETETGVGTEGRTGGRGEDRGLETDGRCRIP